MADLSTKYMGLELKNPIIVASCGLVSTSEGVKRCADAGAGAVVLKSLFEEQIDMESRDLVAEQSWLYGHPEAFDYASGMSKELGPRDYLKLIESAKASVSIPVIASLNCISPKWWVDYAQQIELAGADGMELNTSIMPSDPDRKSSDVENLYLDVLQEVSSHVKIPIAVKVGPYFSSMANVALELSKRGAKALVLFNRFYQLDIDVENVKLKPGYRFSSPDEISLPLRWIALLSGRIGCDLAASTGVHDGLDVIKQILAGATAVQVCSALYLKGLKQVGSMLETVENWMSGHGHSSPEDFRGRLSQMESDKPELYERLQYIRALSKSE
jgi:dihydroorotate dehydrogenase (fumarate)